MTCLGTVTLFKEDRSPVQVEVHTLGRRYWLIDLTQDKGVGSLLLSSNSEETEILAVSNATNSYGNDKIHMGGILMECAVAAFISSSSKRLIVHANGYSAPQWFYMSQGFVRIDDETNEVRLWRFYGAEQIYAQLENDEDLVGEEFELYNTQRASLAAALGVQEEDLHFEDVCKIKDIGSEMRKIFNHAVSQKKKAPIMDLPHMVMQMTVEGRKRWMTTILTSTLPHKPALLCKLQTWKTIEECVRQDVPKNVADEIAEFVGAE